MAHWIVFIVIGLLFGYLVSWVTESRSVLLPLAGGLVGAVIGGEAFRLLMGAGDPDTVWASFFIAMVVGSIVAWAPTHHRLHADAMEYAETRHNPSPPSAGA